MVKTICGHSTLEISYRKAFRIEELVVIVKEDNATNKP